MTILDEIKFNENVPYSSFNEKRRCEDVRMYNKGYNNGIYAGARCILKAAGVIEVLKEARSYVPHIASPNDRYNCDYFDCPRCKLDKVLKMTEEEFRSKDLTVHPRQAEILQNNYRVFMKRQRAATDENYSVQCLKDAHQAASDYFQITGKAIEE